MDDLTIWRAGPRIGGQFATGVKERGARARKLATYEKGASR
jgi:hypothetical protein